MAAKNNLLSVGGNVRPDRQTEWSCGRNIQTNPINISTKIHHDGQDRSGQREREREQEVDPFNVMRGFVL